MKQAVRCPQGLLPSASSDITCSIFVLVGPCAGVKPPPSGSGCVHRHRAVPAGPLAFHPVATGRRRARWGARQRPQAKGSCHDHQTSSRSRRHYRWSRHCHVARGGPCCQRPRAHVRTARLHIDGQIGSPAREGTRKTCQAAGDPPLGPRRRRPFRGRAGCRTTSLRHRLFGLWQRRSRLVQLFGSATDLPPARPALPRLSLVCRRVREGLPARLSTHADSAWQQSRCHARHVSRDP